MNLILPHLFNSSLTSQLMSASGVKVYGCFTWPFIDDDVRYVGISVLGISSPVGFTVAVEGINASRQPDGTPLAVATNWTPAVGYGWVDVGAIAVAQGAKVSAGITYGSSGTATVNYGAGAAAYPYGATFALGSWTLRLQCPLIALKSASGRIVPGSVLAASQTTTNINSSERACVFTPAVGCYLIGAAAFVPAASAAALALRLFAGTSTTPTNTAPIAQTIGGGNNSWISARFDTATLLTANQQYRLSLQETSGNAQGTYRWNFADNADLNATLGVGATGITVNGSDNRTSGAWAGTTDTQAEMIIPIISSIAPSGGGGGGGMGLGL